MTKEQQYWEDTQEALSRIFDRCEEIDPQSGYNMLEDIQFVRCFINKHKPQPKTGYISTDDVMSVFDDFMCGEVDEDGTETFLEMLKDKAESEG